jgi:hypothetical protein
MAIRDIYDEPNITLIRVMYRSTHSVCIDQSDCYSRQMLHMLLHELSVMLPGCETFWCYPAEST